MKTLPSSDALRTQIMEAGPRSRAVYAGARRTLVLPSHVRRRGAVRGLNGDSKFALDPTKGNKILAPEEAPEAQAVVARVDETVSGLDLLHMVFPNKPYVHTGLLDTETLERDDPLVDFALSPELVAAVSRYLGVVPVLRQVGVWASRYHPSVNKGSQLFHCDTLATAQVKVFVYATDVGPADGPLTVIDADASTRAMKTLGYRFRSRVTDPEMEAAVRPDQIHPITGPRGTVAMVDTSRCFHMGSRLTEESKLRVLAMFQYVGLVSFQSSRRETSPFSRFVDADTPRVERMLLGAG